MSFYLTWYEKEGSRHLGERLMDVSRDDIRKAFNLGGRETLKRQRVTEKQQGWLNDMFPELIVPIMTYAYFVEERSE